MPFKRLHLLYLHALFDPLAISDVKFISCFVRYSLIIVSFVQDALRLYLINSPVVRAEPLRFKKDGVYSVVSKFCSLSFACCVWHGLQIPCFPFMVVDFILVWPLK